MKKISDEILRLDIKKLLNALNIIYRDVGSYYQCMCPVHGSDNYNSMTIYKDSGNWVCWTNFCHEKYYGLVGLAIGTLDRLGIKNKREFFESFENNVPNNLERQEIPTREVVKINLSRDSIRSSLQIPSKYYTDKGFCPKILDEFDVGECYNPEKPMFNRVVFPVYDKDGDYVGCSGRSLIDKKYIMKWRHSPGLPSSLTFYGIHKALDHIKEYKTVVLVEGLGDVVKLHEYGIKNAIGAFGAKLSFGQANLLKELGVKNMLLCLDPDPDRFDPIKQITIKGTGYAAMDRILSRYGKEFNIKIVDLVNKDPDELTQTEALSLLKV